MTAGLGTLLLVTLDASINLYKTIKIKIAKTNSRGAISSEAVTDISYFYFVKASWVQTKGFWISFKFLLAGLQGGMLGVNCATLISLHEIKLFLLKAAFVHTSDGCAACGC